MQDTKTSKDTLPNLDYLRQELDISLIVINAAREPTVNFGISIPEERLEQLGISPEDSSNVELFGVDSQDIKRIKTNREKLMQAIASYNASIVYVIKTAKSCLDDVASDLDEQESSE